MTRRVEADCIEGLEPFAVEEIKRAGGLIRAAAHGIVQFDYTGQPDRLLNLRTVLAVYLVQRFDVPRPKALLGDQHLRTLLAQVDAAMAAGPRGAYRTFMLGAAGAESAVMQRIKQAVAAHTSLSEVQGDGHLLMRLRPSGATPPSPHLPQGRSASSPRGERAGGWDVLVRLGPRPLATREWRACVIEGALQATVAHVMATLTQPKPDDVYLNVCCGSGTLLIERAMHGKAARLMGCDIDVNALACATRNVKASGRHIELHTWDAKTLPLPEASVDAITADLPFGVRVGTHANNEALYPAVLREAARVAKSGARFVLISAEVKLLERVLREQKYWTTDRMLRVNLGGLRPMIVVLRRAKDHV